MRRYVGYVVMCAAVLLGIGASTAPFISKMNSDLAYSDGKTLYFKASEYIQDSTNGNYDSFLDGEQRDANNDNQPVIYTLADIVKSRLDTWNLSEYEVSVQGYDTIAVSVRAKTDTETQYKYLESYLSFSGGDYELDLTDETVSDESWDVKWASMLDDTEDAYIESMELNGYNFPFVLVKIPDDYKDSFNTLIDLAEKTNSDAKSASSDSSSSSSNEDACKLILWANREENDHYSDYSENSNLANKVLAVESVSNDNARYYYDSDEDKENPYLRLIPASNAITSEGSYDPTYAQEAYEAAVYLRNMFNAEPLAIKNGTTETRFALNFTYSERAEARVESLNFISAWSVYPSFGGTMIAILVTAVLTCLVLCLTYRIFGLVQATSIIGTVYATFITFVSFGAQFNVAALLGLLVVMSIAAFGAIYYAATLKDEIYKGRTLKKANQEAAKKSTWPIIDASIIGAIAGVFAYIFGGDLASKFGTVLVLGSVFALAANLIITRIGAWLLCNDSFMQTSYPKQLNIDEKKIPDLLKEEKQSYFGPYEKKDFSKGKKWLGGIFGAIVTAGIATMIVFGLANGGNIYNTAAYTEKSTVLRIDVKSTKDDMISISKISSIDDVYKQDGDDDLLHCVKIDDTVLSSLTTLDDVKVSETPRTVYDSDTKEKSYWYYYSISLSKYIANEIDSTHKIEFKEADGKFKESQADSIDDALRDYMTSTFLTGADDTNIIVTFATVTPELGQPYIDKIALAVGVSLAVALVYMMIRFRPSRGIAAIFGAALVSYCSLAFICFTRLAVTPLVSLGALAVSVSALLLALFALNKEKEIYKDSREKEKNNLPFRSDCLNKGVSRSAGSYLLLLCILAYGCIAFFGFGPKTYMMIYLCFIMGVIFLGAYNLGLLAPISIWIAKILGKIKFKPKRIKKAKKGVAMKKKSSEPEEAIFIGIND